MRERRPTRCGPLRAKLFEEDTSREKAFKRRPLKRWALEGQDLEGQKFKLGRQILERGIREEQFLEGVHPSRTRLREQVVGRHTASKDKHWEAGLCRVMSSEESARDDFLQVYCLQGQAFGDKSFMAHFL